VSGISLAPNAALVLWAQVALLLAAARLLGALVRRFGQPDIVGSLLAGVLLGPSVLGQAWPLAHHWFMAPDDPTQRHLLGAVTGFSLLMLLIVLGAEVDLGLLRRLGRAAASVSAGSIVLPAAAGIAVAWLLVNQLSPSAAHSAAAAVAIGGALSVSSLPVVARIVIELRLGRRDAGQLAIAAASANDVYGFGLLVALSIMVGSAGLVDVVLPIAGLVVLGALLVFGGQRLVDRLLRAVRRGGPNVAGSLTVSVVFAIGLAAAAEAMHIDAALGAFAGGVVLGRSRFQHGPAMRSLETYAAAIFAPLYFASAGLQVDVTLLASGPVIVALLVVLAVAVASKFAGAAAGGALAGLPARQCSALGVALNGRGAMQIIIGTAALSMGAIDETGLTIILLISIVTSMVVSPTLRRTIGDWPGSAGEQERVAHEDRLDKNVIVKGQRLLLPTRGSPNAQAAALVMDRVWPPESELTLLTIADGAASALAADGGEPASEIQLHTDRQVRRLRIDADNVVDAILAEANLGYGVIGVGTVEDPEPGRLLAPGISELLNRSPLPLLIVRRATAGLPTGDFRRVVAAVNGTAASRAAQEIAHSLASRGGAGVDLLHVVTRPDGSAQQAADAVLIHASEVARAHGVRAGTAQRTGTAAGAQIVDYVDDVGADAVVVGTRVRRLGDRPFLGHTVEHVLEHCPHTSVLAVVVPDEGGSLGKEPYADRAER
jgi:Kef-type K+ transport system membrane component KefB/nucleotide-binding universal stress UspA family protein